MKKNHFDKRIVIDADNTLCITEEGVPYSQRKPKMDVIKKLREYRRDGFYIIICTSRQMRTYEGNIGLINANVLPVLIDWLNKYDVPYDEIHVGKPWHGFNGFCVDDSTIRPDEFVNLSYKKIKELLEEDEM